MNDYEAPTIQHLGGEDNLNHINGILILAVVLAIALFLVLIEVPSPPPLY